MFSGVSNLGHDVLVVVVAQRAAEFVVVHVRLALALAPASSDLVRVRQLELARRPVPRDARRVSGVRQQLEQELPQLDLSASCVRISTAQRTPLKPYSITLAGSKLAADRFEAKFHYEPASNQLQTSSEPDSVMKFGFLLDCHGVCTKDSTAINNTI